MFYLQNMVIQLNVVKVFLQRYRPLFLKLPGRQMNLVLIDQALVSGTNFLTGMLLARFLDIGEYGRFTLAWMFLLLANMIQSALILQPMMSIAPQQSVQDAPGYYGAVIAQQAALGIILSILLYFFVLISGKYFPQWQIASLAFPLSVTLLAFQAQDFIRRYFFTHRQIGLVLINDCISYGMQIVVLCILFFNIKIKTDGVLWVIAATSCIAAISGFLKMQSLRWCVEDFKKVLKRHWHFSKWISLGSIMQYIAGQYFVIVPATLFSSVAVGAIAAARNVVGISLVICAAVENIVSVNASLAYREGGWPALKHYILKVSITGGLVNGIFCLIGAVFASYWMQILLGNRYVPYSYLVGWFAITHFLMFFIRPLTSLLRAVEYTKPIAVSNFLPMIFSLLASVPLVQTFGITGAMIVMLGMTVLTLIYLLSVTVYWRKRALS